jgi:predicted NUDIX family phosphoesterase
MAQDEQVLVVERKVIEQMGMFHGLTFDVDRYLRKIFLQGVARFMPRPQAEKDPAYKQIIPYVIMAYEGKYLSYVRGKRAGEKRLVARRSIGIGGHINPVDDMPLFNADFYETYITAVEREVAEEVSVEADHTDLRRTPHGGIVALLNDDSNEVGSVHLGIVHYWRLDAPEASKREQMINQISFMTPAELHDVRDTLETWSGLCLDGLAEMEKIAQSGLKPDTSLRKQ